MVGYCRCIRVPLLRIQSSQRLLKPWREAEYSFYTHSSARNSAKFCLPSSIIVTPSPQFYHSKFCLPSSISCIFYTPPALFMFPALGLRANTEHKWKHVYFPPCALLAYSSTVGCTSDNTDGKEVSKYLDVVHPVNQYMDGN